MKKVEYKNLEQTTLIESVKMSIGELSVSDIRKMLAKKDILIDGKRQKEDRELFGGESVVCFFALKEQNYFEVIFEDDNVLIVNKRAGIEVCDGENNVERILSKKHEFVKAVHRIDRNTEGLVIFAKNQCSYEILSRAIKSKDEIKKTYIAHVLGSFRKKKFEEVAYLKKFPQQSIVKISADKDFGVQIRTFFEVIHSDGETTLLRVGLLTGKTHQIRAHLAFLNHPIIGDGKYGDYAVNKKFGAKVQRLCACEIRFNLQGRLKYLNDLMFCVEPSWRA